MEIIKATDTKNSNKKIITFKHEEKEESFAFFITNPIFFHFLSTVERLNTQPEKYYTTMLNYLEALVGGSEKIIAINSLYQEAGEEFDLEHIIIAIVESLEIEEDTKNPKGK